MKLVISPSTLSSPRVLRLESALDTRFPNHVFQQLEMSQRYLLGVTMSWFPHLLLFIFEQYCGGWRWNIKTEMRIEQMGGQGGRIIGYIYTDLGTEELGDKGYEMILNSTGYWLVFQEKREE